MIPSLEKLYFVAERPAFSRTFELFQSKTDAWLYEERDFWSGQKANFYYMWFHVFEDEINHRGQIRWLKKRLRG